MDEMTRHRKQRLRELVDRPPYNGSQLDFAIAVSLSEGRISQLLHSEQSFGERSAKKIEAALGLDDRYFDQGYTETEMSDFLPVRRAAVRMSNGTGQVFYREDDKPPLSFRADFLRRLHIPQGKAVVVDAVGHSNEPKIPEDSVVLINTADTERLNGEFFAFRVNGELLIKRLEMIPGVGILATAENSDFRPKQKIYTAKDEIEVIGRAVWTGAEL